MNTQEKRIKFLVYTPFTGLGLYGGHRGKRWLKNRIKVFKQFVVPSLLNQTDRDFTHWISWRREDKGDKDILELEQYLKAIPNYNAVFTYEGIAFWDDKFEDSVARGRLFDSLRRTLPDLFDHVTDCEEVYWLLQPSDDLYDRMTVQSVKLAFQDPSMQAISFTKGYLCNYTTKDVLEYNPKTNPPFFAIKFPRETFFDPGKHINYTGPYKSHEYIGEKLKLAYFEGRGFMVGTHGENISTNFDHPYGGLRIEGPDREHLFYNFGIQGAEPLHLKLSVRKWLMRKLPHPIRRKLRYWFGELFYSRFYEWIRS
jgi:hypothetical protein